MPDRQAAADFVGRELGRRGWNASDLARAAGVDMGTVGDFLRATRWPQRASRGRIEAALDLPAGSIEAVGLGRAVTTADDERPVSEIEEELGAIFATKPGISPAEREAAKRIALGSVRAYLETLEERGDE